MIVIDLSLHNDWLYSGCEIEDVNGRPNVATPVVDAMAIIGRNINQKIQSLSREERDTCRLTGAMAIWAYLIVFHAVVHAFTVVEYDNGRNGSVLIAKHG